MSIMHTITIEVEEDIWKELVELADNPNIDCPKDDLTGEHISELASSLFADAVSELYKNMKEEQNAPNPN